MRTSTVIKLSIATAGAGLIVLAAAESVAAATFYSITDLGNWSPTALNNWSQQIVGNSITADGNTHAVLWQNGTITDLGTLGSDYNNSQATGINDLGQVVGNSYNTVCSDRWGMTSYGDSRGFLWQNGNMINLGTLDSNDSCSQAAAINNMGQVVGTSYARMPTNPYSGYRSFLWEHGGMTEPGGFYNLMFNNLLLNNSGWVLSSASAINNRGQIVGIGTFNGQSRGFLLTPSSQQYSVPEPSETFALLALGFFGATTMLKRQRHASATTTAKNNI